MLRFEWDENKNQINRKKHGISFETAKTVFFDDGAVVFDDPDHSFGEERFLILGYAENAWICIVSHCYRENDVIRIISAREATAKEKKIYRSWNGGNDYERRI